jgi:hypothetical protein
MSVLKAPFAGRQNATGVGFRARPDVVGEIRACDDPDIELLRGRGQAGGDPDRRREEAAVQRAASETKHGGRRSDASGQDFFDDLAVDVGQAEMAALVFVGQPKVIDAETVQNGGL